MQRAELISQLRSANVDSRQTSESSMFSLAASTAFFLSICRAEAVKLNSRMVCLL